MHKIARNDNDWRYDRGPVRFTFGPVRSPDCLACLGGVTLPLILADLRIMITGGARSLLAQNVHVG